MSRMSSAGCWLTKTLGTALDRLARQVGLDVLPVVLRRQLREAGGQRPGRRPRALDVSRLQPPVVVPQIEGLGRIVLKQVPVRVDRELQVVVFDRAPDRLAVEVHDHRGRLAEEDRRGIGLDALDVLGHDLALVEIGQDTIESDHTFVIRKRLVDPGDDLLHLLFRQGREIRFDDLELLKVDQAIFEGDLRLRLEPDRPDRRFVGSLGTMRHRTEGHHVRLLVPARDLRLIDEDRGAAR